MVCIRLGIRVRAIKNAILVRDLVGIINHKEMMERPHDGYILIYVLICKYNDVIE